MSKKYAPFRISNPYEGHKVLLLPNQTFSVTLTGNKSEIEFKSPFFDLAEIVHKPDAKVFNFTQTYDLSFWSKVSRVYLGEVVTMCDSHPGSMNVFLNSDNGNFVTIINPTVNFIKVELDTVLELVVYDTSFFGGWDCTVISGDSGLKFEQLEYRQIDPRNSASAFHDSGDKYFLLPRAPLFNDVPLREHHYWFRIDYSSMVTAASLTSGVYSAGKIIFDSGQNGFKILNPQINIREKNKAKLFDLQKKDSSMTIVYPNDLKTNNKIRKYIPQSRDSIFKQEIVLKKKLDEELHSEHVVYY